MTVDGTDYTILELVTGWWVCTKDLAVAGPYRTRGEALSAAIARSRQNARAAA